MPYLRTTSANLVIAASALLTACGTAEGSGSGSGSGPTTTEQRPVDGVHAVELQTSGDLTITVGQTPQLTITAGRTTLRNLTSTLRDGTVILSSRSGHATTGDIHYELTLPTLDGLVVAGSGSARGSVAAGGSITVTVSGSGSADIDGVAATELIVALSGSGDIDLAGTTDKQVVGLDGSGSYHGTDLVSQTSDVQVNGSGNAQITATEQLDAQIRGSGDLSYTGTPVLVTQISGNGTISAGTP
jgi:hypothetical protein